MQDLIFLEALIVCAANATTSYDSDDEVALDSNENLWFTEARNPFILSICALRLIVLNLVLLLSEYMEILGDRLMQCFQDAIERTSQVKVDMECKCKLSFHGGIG
ncbi:hypothetical protein Tco_0640407 [Tanacetum coccineum]